MVWQQTSTHLQRAISSFFPHVRTAPLIGSKMGKSPWTRTSIAVISCILLFITETHANSTHLFEYSTPTSEVAFPVAEAVFSSNLISNALMIGGSCMVLLFMCGCVSTRFLSISDPFGICRDSCDCACGGCGMMEEMVFCCTIS